MYLTLRGRSRNFCAAALFWANFQITSSPSRARARSARAGPDGIGASDDPASAMLAVRLSAVRVIEIAFKVIESRPATTPGCSTPPSTRRSRSTSRSGRAPVELERVDSSSCVFRVDAVLLVLDEAAEAHHQRHQAMFESISFDMPMPIGWPSPSASAPPCRTLSHVVGARARPRPEVAPLDDRVGHVGVREGEVLLRLRVVGEPCASPPSCRPSLDLADDRAWLITWSSYAASGAR